MTREQFDRTMRLMEQNAELRMEVCSKAEARRLEREYSAMWAAVRPYVGGKQFEEDTSGEARERRRRALMPSTEPVTCTPRPLVTFGKLGR